MQKKVSGIGGIFFKSKDSQPIYEWYSKRLGIRCSEYGTVFKWREENNKEQVGYTV